MIQLRPTTDVKLECVYCRTVLECSGWYLPGMRNLAELRCLQCRREFYGDLAAGQALYTPLLLEKETGVVHDPFGVGWFAGWLRDSYAARSSTPLPFAVEEFAPVTQAVVLLNCLDTLYGHSLLKLLNAQYYLDRRPDLDLIVICPKFLRWMVPDGVAQVWVVDLPLTRGTEWNDWLAGEVSRRLEAFATVHLSMAFSHPHPGDYNIERFTRVKPFPLHEWEVRQGRSTVTFIWREDRLWQPKIGSIAQIKQRIKHGTTEGQRRTVLDAASALRQELPALDFAVAGIGKPGDLPEWVFDLRRPRPDATVEREWCARYAASHLIVGVHGSNMLLPSAHAGGAVELIGPERQGNYLQDILFREGDSREMFFRYRFMPATTTAGEIARLLGLMLRRYPDFQKLMSPEFCRHETNHEPSVWQSRRHDSSSS